MLKYLKSWLLPALFFSTTWVYADPITLTAQLSEAKIEQLAEHPQWQALLHLRNGQPMITDQAFILSDPDFSSLSELMLTIELLRKDYSNALCRFPARATWLSMQVDATLTTNAFQHCDSLNEYLTHVPFDEVDLIFASEVLSSASSMMGHVFLKAKGENVRQNSVQHAISFFTEFDTFNPLRLIYDGLVGGMSGFFIVRPYTKELNRYLNVENRNLFEYELALNEFQKRLIQLHIWELKGIEIEYLFQSYNCATLTLYILSVAEPGIKNSEGMFVTPADVVKAAREYEILGETQVNLSNEWAITSMELQLEPPRIEALQTHLINNTLPISSGELALSAIEIDYVKRLAATPHYYPNINEQLLLALENTELPTNTHFAIDNTAAKNPASSPQDSILSVQLQRASYENRLRFNMLPVSHYLRTTNEQFLSESELKIGELSVSIGSENANLRLEQFTLYSFTSLVPSTTSQPRNSSSLFMGYRQKRDGNLDTQGFATIEGGLGKSYRAHRDIITYGLIELSTGSTLKNQFVSAGAKAGVIFNLAWGTKLRAEYSLTESNLTDSFLRHSVLELSNQTSLNRNLFLSAENWQHQDNHELVITLGIDWHF